MPNPKPSSFLILYSPFSKCYNQSLFLKSIKLWKTIITLSFVSKFCQNLSTPHICPLPFFLSGQLYIPLHMDHCTSLLPGFFDFIVCLPSIFYTTASIKFLTCKLSDVLPLLKSIQMCPISQRIESKSYIPIWTLEEKWSFLSKYLLPS
jgi:hypothetical protein